MQVNDIKRVGVAGAGLMGHGIAFAFALGGYPTTMTDVSDEVLQIAMTKIRSTAGLFVEEALITPEEAAAALARISLTTDLAELARASDFVTEAIVERAEDKRKLFNELDRLCPPSTIIVSNTSTLMLSDFAADVRRQDKIAVTHYFAPPAIVPGVEVARGPGTSDETYEIACRMMENVNHVPIRVLKEQPGYLINSIQDAMMREVLRLWAEGVAAAEDIERGIESTFGFRMPDQGPLLHYDVAGIFGWPVDVRARVVDSVLKERPIGAEGTRTIRERYAAGTPWFVDPAGLEEATAVIHRKYARRLKELYWKKG